MAEVFGPPAAEAPAREKPLTAEEVERRVKAFFSYLDSRDYVQAYELEGGCYQQYLQAVEALSAQSAQGRRRNRVPVRDAEKRVVLLPRDRQKARPGRRRHSSNEHDVMEPAMRVFYLWYTGPSDKLKGRPSLPTMYAIRELPARHLRRPQLSACAAIPGSGC